MFPHHHHNRFDAEEKFIENLERNIISEEEKLIQQQLLYQQMQAQQMEQQQLMQLQNQNRLLQNQVMTQQPQYPYQQQMYGQQQNMMYGQQQNMMYGQQQQQPYNPYQQQGMQQQYQQQQYLQGQQQPQYGQQQQPQYGQQQQQYGQQQQQQQQYNPFYCQQRRVFNLKEKWFTLTDTLAVMDERGQQAYKAVGKFFHLGVDMYIKDANGSTLCELKSKIISLMPEFDFYQNGQVIGKIRKEVHLLGGEKWHFTDLKKNQQWELSGDFVNYDWRIHQGSTVAAEITRKHSFIKEHYGVSVEPGADLTEIICVAVCMEKYHHDHSLKK